MDLVVPPEIVEFATVARKSLSRPGLYLTRSAEASGSFTEVHATLESLGAAELDPLSGAELGLAAAVLAQEVGRAALPVAFPAITIGRSLELPGQVPAIGALPSGPFLVDHARTDPPTYVLDEGGVVHRVEPAEDAGETRPLAPAAGPVRATGEHRDLGERGLLAWAWHETLCAFSSLGALEQAVDLTRHHLNERHQFGKPLRSRQALEHRFVDSVVDVARLREMALFTAWRLSAGDPDIVGAACALRLVHLEVIGTVTRHAHQIHGAVGFCFEHDLAVLTRYLQFRRYQPAGLRETRNRLGRHLDSIPSLHSPNGPHAVTKETTSTSWT